MPSSSSKSDIEVVTMDTYMGDAKSRKSVLLSADAE